MREKLLFLGMLLLSALYTIEVFSRSGIGLLQWIGLTIVALTVIPWIIDRVVARRKKRRRREEQAAYKELNQAKKGQDM